MIVDDRLIWPLMGIYFVPFRTYNADAAGASERHLTVDMTNLE
jgi:hypothetical protein